MSKYLGHNRIQKLKGEKGSVTLFVLIAMIFFLTVGITVYIANVNSRQSQEKEISKIQYEYGKNNDLNTIYNEQVDKVQQKLLVTVIDSDGNKYIEKTWTNKVPLKVEVNWPDGTSDANKVITVKDLNNSPIVENKTETYINDNAILSKSCILTTTLNGTTVSVKILVDTTAPTIEIDPDKGTYTLAEGETTKNISTDGMVTVTDTQSGVAKKEYAWTTSTEQPQNGWTQYNDAREIGNNFNLGKGTYYLHIKATDAAENISYACSKEFRVITQEEAQTYIRIVPETEEWTKDDVNVNIYYNSIFKDNSIKRAGFGTTEETAKSNASITTAKKVVATENGWVYAEANIDSGDYVSNQKQITNIDKTAPSKPVVERSYYSDGSGDYTSGTWTNHQVLTKITSSDTQSGVKEIQYSFDKTTWTKLKFNPEGSVKDGDTYYGIERWWLVNRDDVVYFKAIDNVGNESEISESFNIKYDITPPTLEITSSASINPTNENSITYTFKFSEDVTDFTKDDISVTNGTKGEFSGSGSTYTLVITNGETGEQKVEVSANKCIDKAGNGNTEASKTINIDKTGPKVTFGTNGNTTYAKSQSTTVTIEDVGTSGVNASTLKYQWTQSTTAPDESSFSTTFKSGDTITKSDGDGNNWHLWILAKDNLGNTTITKSNAFYLDNTAPTFTNYEIKNLSTTGYDIYVYGITDAGSGVNRVQFPTWTEANGQDDIQSNWQTDSKATGVKQSDGTTWVYRVNVTDHKNEYEKYITHVYVYDNLGSSKCIINDIQPTVPAVNITYDNNYLENNLWADTDDLSKYLSAATSPSASINTKDTSVMNGYINEFTMNAGTSGGVYYKPSARLTVGKQYTWSVYVKASSNKILYIGDEQNGRKNVNVTTSWQKITHTFTANDNQAYAFVFYVTGGSSWTAGDKLYVHSLEIKEGESLDVSTVQKGYGTELGTSSTPTRTGYTFAGWFTAPTGGTQISSTTTTPASDTTYYAHWTINSYNVTFNGNVISTSFDNETVVLDTTGTNVPECRSSKLSLETNTKYLLSFDYVIDTGSNLFDVDLYPDDLPQTLLTATTTKQHAEWEITSSSANMSNCYLRFFDDKDQSNDTGKITITNIVLYKLESKQYMYNEKLGTLPKPTRTGYTLTGWFTAPTDGAQISSGTRVPANDVSYYAHWKANTNTPYKVIHQQMGLDGKTYTTVDTENLTGTTDAKITPATKTYTGFTAPATQEVKIKCDGTTEVIYKYTRNQYKQIVQIRYENADGTYGEYTNEIDTNYYYGATVSWSRAADTTYQAASITSYTVTEAKTTQVNVLRNVFKFDLNGYLDGKVVGNITGYGTADVYINGVKVESGATDCYRDVRYGSTYEVKNIIANTGYQYNGTYNSTLTGTITRTTNVTINFTIINYTITYNLNGGSVATENPTSYNVKTEEITLNNPTKTGYTFSGWTGSNGTTLQTSVSIPTGSTGNRTYTANWTAKTVNVTFNRNTSPSDTTTATQSFTYGVSGQKFSEKGWTKTGYTLLGWSESSTATTATYSVTNGVSDSWIDGRYPSVNLYAVWKINSYTVTYNYNNELVSNGNFSNGLTGWSNSSNGVGTLDTNVKYNNQNSVRIYDSTIGWNGIRTSYNVSYKPATTYKITVAAYRDSSSSYGDLNKVVRVYLPEYKSDSTVLNYRAYINISSSNLPDKTWKEFTATFTTDATQGSSFGPLLIDSNNISGTNNIWISGIKVEEVKNDTKNYGSQLGTLPTPTRTGYTLDGWYTAPTGGTKISSTTTMPANDVTYYAQWAEKKAESLTLDKTTASIEYLGSTTIKGTLSPSDVYNNKINWTTSNSNVCAISATTSTSGGTITLTAKGVGTATITAIAADGSGKTASCTVTVTAKNASTFTVALNPTSYTYDGTAKTPAATVKDGSTTLTANTHYTVSYSNNTNAGTGTVTITGKGNYTGTKTANFTINKRAITVTAGSSSKTYDGAALTNTSATLTSGSLVSGHTITVTNTGSITNVGSTTNTLSTVVIKSGSTDVSANYAITKANGTLTITAKNASTFTVTLNPTSYTYDGAAKTPAATVKDGNTTLTANTHYTVSYSNNTNAGTGTVTITGKGNYTGTKTANFTINKRAITVTAGSNSKTYDGAALTNTSATLTSGSLVSGHTLTATATGSITNVGSATNTVNSAVVKSGSTDVSANYAITKANGTLTVNKRTLTVKADAKSKTYGAANPSLTYTYSGQVSGQTPKFSGALTTSATASSGVGSYDITQGTLALADNSPFLVSNYTLAYTKASLTINAKNASTFTVTLNPTSYTYDGTAKTPTATVKDGSTTLTKDTHYTVSYSNNTNAGTGTVTITGKGNYTGTKTANFTINKRAITVTAGSSSKTYDGAALTNTSATLTSGTLASRHTLTATATGSITNVGSATNTVNSAVVKSGSTDVSANYTITKANGTLTVNKRTITVTAGAKSKTYGAANPSLTYTYSGQVSGQTPKFSGALATTATTSSNVGSYDITVGTLALADNSPFLASNYTLAYTKASLTINAKNASTFTVTLNPTSYTYDGTAKTPTATVKDGSTTLTKDTHYTVSYSNNTNAGTGTVTITGKGNYTGTKTANFTINKRAITVTAGSSSKTYDGAALTNTSATLTSGTLASGHTLTATATGSITNVGSATNTVNSAVVKSGSTDVSANYTITKANGTLTVNKRTITVTAGAKSKTYGAANPSLTYTYSGQVSGQTPKFSGALATSATTSSNVGSYDITQGTLALADNSPFLANNYTIAYTKASLTINKANAANPTLSDVTVTYDGAAHAIGVSGGSGGTINYRTSTNNSTWGSWSTTRPSLTNVGTLYVQAYVVGDGNHNNTSATASKKITINKRTLTVTAAAKSKTYGAANPSLTYTYSGQVSGQTPKFSGALTTSATASSGVGNYDITQGTLALADNSPFLVSNYTLAYTKASLTINKANAVNPTLSDVTVTYDGAAHAIGVSGGSGGTINYRTSTNNSTWGSWSTTKPSLTNVGTLYVQAYVVGDGNHNSTSATASKKITITRAKTASAAAANKTYNGSAQTGVSGSYVSWSGTTSATNAGSYTATATPDGNHAWSDGTTGAKNITWTMSKATLSLGLNATSGSASYANGTNSFTVTPSGYKGSDTGTLSVTSGNTTYVTITSGNGSAAKNSTAITVGYKAIKYSSSTVNITVSIAATTNYNAVSKTYTVTITDPVAPNGAPTITAKKTNSSGATISTINGGTANVGPTLVWTNVAATYLAFSGGADAGSGVKTYAYATSPTGTKTDATSVTFNATTSGVTYYAFTKDNAGNYSTIYTAITVKLDTAAPTVGTVTAQIVSGTQLNVNITGGADTGGSGIKSYTVYNSSGTAQGSEYSSSASATVSLTSNTGWYANNYVVRAQDYAGNTSTTAVGISYYTVSTLDGLKGLSTATNASNGGTFSGRTVKQTASISNVSGFTPIGTSYDKCFSGNYDGQNNTISFSNQTFANQYSGVFGYIKDGATIQNLTVSGNITANSGNTGGIVGTARDSKITSCRSLVNITSTSDLIGGIVGSTSLTTGNEISGCVFSGTVTGKSNVGGILGSSQNVNGDTITNCTSSGQITATGNDVGGIAGHLGGTITKCTNNATVQTTGTTVGGIAGEVTGRNNRRLYK